MSASPNRLFACQTLPQVESSGKTIHSDSAKEGETLSLQQNMLYVISIRDKAYKIVP